MFNLQKGIFREKGKRKKAITRKKRENKILKKTCCVKPSSLLNTTVKASRYREQYMIDTKSAVF